LVAYALTTFVCCHCAFGPDCLVVTYYDGFYWFRLHTFAFGYVVTRLHSRLRCGYDLTRPHTRLRAPVVMPVVVPYLAARPVVTPGCWLPCCTLRLPVRALRCRFVTRYPVGFVPVRCRTVTFTLLYALHVCCRCWLDVYVGLPLLFGYVPHTFAVAGCWFDVTRTFPPYALRLHVVRDV